MEKRKKIITKINNEIIEIENHSAFLNLANYLRKDLDKPGTKIVCGEGDCGACTVLLGKEFDENGKLIYKSVNSCILPLYLLDGAHIVTVEGVKEETGLHEVQDQMIKHHGSQCGYCTPGFICSMAYMAENLKQQDKEITEKRAKNYLTGNLCRCTGYKPILDAAVNIDLNKVTPLNDRFDNTEWRKQAKKIKEDSLLLTAEGFQIMLPATLDEALLLKAVEPKLKIVAGNTDLGVMANKGKGQSLDILSLTHIKELRQIKFTKDFITVGSTVTLTEFEDFVEEKIPELKNLLHIFASPQIKNQGTLIGNVLNASPIGDTIPFLMAMGAIVLIESAKEAREVQLEKFYTGYKQLDLKSDEIVVGIKIPRLLSDEKLALYKVSMRKDLDISAVTFAGKIKLKNNKIENITLAMGGVGPIVTRLPVCEKNFIGQEFNFNIFDQEAKKMDQYINPIADLRASREYRILLAQNFLRKFYFELVGQAE